MPAQCIKIVDRFVNFNHQNESQSAIEGQNGLGRASRTDWATKLFRSRFQPGCNVVSPTFKNLTILKPLSQIVSVPLRFATHQHQPPAWTQRPQRRFDKVLSNSEIRVVRRVAQGHVELFFSIAQLSVVIDFGDDVLDLI